MNYFECCFVGLASQVVTGTAQSCYYSANYLINAYLNAYIFLTVDCNDYD